MNWSIPAPQWDTVAGRVLDAFFGGLREALPSYDLPLTVFGSAAIQLCVDDQFASADVDLMVMAEGEKLREVAANQGVGRSGTVRPDYGLQICPPQLFRTTPHYLARAWVEKRSGFTVIVPHVRDILIGKLHRHRSDDQHDLAAKDRRAFHRVRELCGGRPSEDDVIEDLRLCEPSFRVPQDGTVNSFRLNALDLFRQVFGRALNLETEILAPARLAEVPAAEGSRPSLESMLESLRPDLD